MKKSDDYGTFRRHLWAVPFELIMAGAAIFTFIHHDMSAFMAALFTFTVSFAPLLCERLFRVRLSALVQALYVGFVFASMFAGEVFYMYRRVVPWDDTTHFISGLLVGLGVMMWLHVLTRRDNVRVRLPVWLQAVFIFCVVATVALLWEVVEFVCDEWFGMTTQDNLFDTMFDLIDGMAGGLIMAVVSVLHLKGKRVPGVHTFFQRFGRLND